MSEFRFSPGSEAKGRNGWIKLDRAVAWMADTEPALVIDFYSARAADTPPACLKFSLDDAMAFARALVDPDVSELAFTDEMLFRGRSGWARGARAVFAPFGIGDLLDSLGGYPVDARISVEVFSGRAAETAPVALSLVPVDAERLAQAIIDLFYHG